MKYAVDESHCRLATVVGIGQFRALIGVRPDLHPPRPKDRRLLLPIERWQAVLSAGQDVHRHLLLQGLGLVQSLRAVPIYRLASFTPAEKPSLIQSRTRRHLRLR